MSAPIGEAAARRHATPIPSVTLRALIYLLVVVVLAAVTPTLPAQLGSYRTGVVTLLAIVLTGLYSARKHTLWLSARVLRLAERLPRMISAPLRLFDRLETWRSVHISAGILVLLPFWWHRQARQAVGGASSLEVALESLLVLVILSGVVGIIIHEFLPHRMAIRPHQEVRVEDVEADFRELYVEAEEKVLGSPETTVRAYLEHVRPLLTGMLPGYYMLWAALRGTEPAPSLCRRAREVLRDNRTYRELVAIAERKLRLEYNLFHLRLTGAWLNLHITLVSILGVLIIFHVTGVIYFAGW